MEITDLLGLILEMSMHNFVEYSWSNEEVFEENFIFGTRFCAENTLSYFHVVWFVM